MGKPLLLPALAALALTSCSERPTPRTGTNQPASQPATPPPAASGQTKLVIPRRTTDLQGDPLPGGAIGRLGSLRYRAEGHSELEFSPDGSSLAINTIAGIALIDPATGRQTRELENLGAPFAFVADGKTMLASEARTVVRVDLESGKHRVIARATDHPNGQPALWLAVAADGTFIHWWEETFEHQLIDIHQLKRPQKRLGRLSNRQVAKYKNNKNGCSLALAPDGKWMALSRDDGIDLWRLPRAKKRVTLSEPGVVDMVFSGPGQLLTATKERIRLWQVTAKKSVRELKTAACVPIRLTPDGTRFLCRDASSKSLEVHDTASGKRLVAIVGQRGIRPVIDPKGRYLAASSHNKKVHVRDLNSGKELSATRGGAIVGLDAARRGKLAATLDEGGVLRLWNLTTGALTRRIAAHYPRSARSVVISPDGKQITTSGDDVQDRKPRIVIWRSDDGSKLGEVKVRAYPSYGPRSGALYWWSDGLFKLDTPGGSPVRLAPPAKLESRVSNKIVAISADERRLLSPWAAHELPGGKRLFSVWHLKVNTLAFLPDGKTFAYGGRTSRGAGLASASTGHSVRPFGSRGWTKRLAVSHDGALAATEGSSPDYGADIWSTSSGKRLAHVGGFGKSILTEVTGLVFAGDGRTLLGASEDGTVLMWDLAQPRAALAREQARKRPDKPSNWRGIPRRSADLHGDPLPKGAIGRLGSIRFRLPDSNGIVAAELSSDDGQLVMIHGSGVVTVWQTASGKMLRSTAKVPNKGEIFISALSPGGHWLATGHQDGAVEVCDLRTGKWLQALAPVQPDPDDVTFDKLQVGDNGVVLVRREASHMPRNYGGPFSGDPIPSTTRVELFNASTRRRGGPTLKKMNQLLLSADGKTLVARTGRRAQVYVLPAKKPRRTIQVKGRPPMQILGDSKTLAAISGDNVQFWDLTTGKRVRTARLPRRAQTERRLSFDGKRGIYRYNSSPTRVEVVELASGKIVARHGHGQLSANGDLLLTKGHTGVDLHRAGQPEIVHDSSVVSLAIAPDGRSLASLAADGKLLIWDLASAKPRRFTLTRQWSKNEGSLHYSKDGRLLMGAVEGSSIVALMVKNGHRTFGLGETPPIGSQLTDKGLYWADTKGAVYRSFPLGSEPTKQFSLKAKPAVFAQSLDGQRTLIDGTVYRTQGGKTLYRLKEPPRAAQFSRDGHLLLTVGKTATVVDARTGTVKRGLKGNKKILLTVAFSTNGRLVAAGGEDNLVYVWEVSSGRLVRKLAGHRHHVNALAFTRDDKIVISASADSTILLWRLH